MKILMLGPDAAGKTTILYKLKLGEVPTTIPTIGYNVETIEHKNISFDITDVGGLASVRVLWKHFCANTDGIIFVVDSTDTERIAEAEQWISDLLENEELRNSILLVFANKQDLPNSMSTAELTEKLNLNTIKNRKWYILATSATEGTGLNEGLDWLAHELANK